MKIVAFCLLSSLTVALVLAFPASHNAIDTVPTAELPPAASAHAGEGTTAPSSTADQLRRPRHLLTKLFSHHPQVIVQPIVVQPSHHSPYPNTYIYNGGGRGYNYGYGGNGYW
ncbi:uncharacterized protein LOC6580414 [Drosophila mojavensis]|uniref:Uncharacterized protein n=1 Tax=Drosophila mojavensis TaxID=7230 RepID=B4KPJ4_DROMO|nr:uncharacterized protein LOC6580414 [Drosophila mojavensis]EDW10190.1 uncharacterized protein Dmoj_GI18669 [Drosophila mojavensis]